MIFQIARWAVLAPADLVATLVAYVASPFLAAWSVLAGRNTLPGRWQWFSTLDDTLDGGQHQWPALYPPNATGVELWWQRTCWICRNPAQGFALKLLGIPGEMVSQVAYSSAQVPLPIGDDLLRFCRRQGVDLARVWWANWLIVEPEARGQDIGRRLIAASMEAIRALGGDLWIFDVLMRPAGHPAAPLDWRPESAYFGHVGFTPAPLPPTPSDWADIDPPGAPVTRKFYQSFFRDLRGP